jgi:VanZ family protein
MTATSPPPPGRSRPNVPAHTWVPVMVWLAVMFFFSSVPDPRAVLSPDILSFGDAVLHGGGFALLAVLAWRVARFLAGGWGMRPVVWTLAACAAYGLFDEVHQVFIPGRGFALIDWLADVGGALVGLGLVWALRAIGRRSRGSA